MIKKFELCTEKEKELLTRMTALQLAVHRHLCTNVTNYKKVHYSHGHIQDLLRMSDNKTTYIKACNHLLNSYLKYSYMSWFDIELAEKIKILIEDISNSSIANELLFNHPFSEKRGELNSFYLLTFLKLLETVSISTASDILNIPVTTIKNACQDRRLKNAEKDGRYWRVNLDECAKLWNKDIERNPILLPYID